MTDNELVYFAETRTGANTLVRVAHSGGEPTVLPAMPVRMQPLDLSATRHELLALEAGPTGSCLPLWVGTLATGGFRRMGSILANIAAWVPRGQRILYSRGHMLYVSNSDCG